jgi:hypothetical protein
MPVSKKKKGGRIKKTSKKTKKPRRPKKLDINFDAPEFNYPEMGKRIPITNDLPELPEMPELPDLPEISDVNIKSLKPLRRPKILPSKLTQDVSSTRIPKKKRRSREAREVKIKSPLKKSRRSDFMRIDHFKDVLSNVDEIGYRIKEISDVIKRLKQIHIREDNEMEKWERELDELKARLEIIEENLSKIESS